MTDTEIETTHFDASRERQDQRKPSQVDGPGLYVEVRSDYERRPDEPASVHTADGTWVGDILCGEVVAVAGNDPEIRRILEAWLADERRRHEEEQKLWAEEQEQEAIKARAAEHANARAALGLPPK